MLVTSLVDHEPIAVDPALLNADALANMLFMSVTIDVDQYPMF